MKRKWTLLGSAALMMFGATSCSIDLINAQNHLNENVVNVLNSNEMVDKVTDVNFNKYAFLAADFVKNENSYTVDINGLALYNDNVNKSYVSLQYEVERDVLNQINKNAAHQVINSLADIVNNYEMKNISFTPMTSVNDFNKCMGKLFNSPENGYNYVSNLTYKVENIKFDYENGNVSFNTLSNTKYCKKVNEAQYVIIGTNPDGSPKSGWKMVTKTYYKKLNQEYEVSVKATDEQLKEMENDHSKIFDKFVELVNENNKEDVIAKSVNTTTSKEFNDNSGYTMQ